MPRDVSKLKCYQLSMDLAVEVIAFTEKLKLYKIADQISASALSVPSNLAEGASYNSEKDFLRFISYSLGSANELETQLQIMQRIHPEIIELDSWRTKCIEIQKMLIGLRKAIASSGQGSK